MIKIILVLILIIPCIIYAIAMINIISGRKLFAKLLHALLKWYVPNENIKFNGLNEISNCKYCGKKIIKCRSSWFTEGC